VKFVLRSRLVSSHKEAVTSVGSTLSLGNPLKRSNIKTSLYNSLPTDCIYACVCIYIENINLSLCIGGAVSML
jgi:hypothetical protein